MNPTLFITDLISANIALNPESFHHLYYARPRRRCEYGGQNRGYVRGQNRRNGYGGRYFLFTRTSVHVGTLVLYARPRYQRETRSNPRYAAEYDLSAQGRRVCRKKQVRYEDRLRGTTPYVQDQRYAQRGDVVVAPVRTKGRNAQNRFRPYRENESACAKIQSGTTGIWTRT